MSRLLTGWPSRCETSSSLEVHLLGLVDFDSAVELQQRLVYELSGRSDRQAALLLCEHPPIVTIGREGSRSHVLADPQELMARQMPVRWLNRGGGCLVHAPGQLAVYPIVPLDRLNMGLMEYRRLLETSVVDVCRSLNVPAHRGDDVPGIRCRHGQLAYLGIAVWSWVAYHGIYVNVSPAMDFLRLVDAGDGHERPATLSIERHRPVAMHAVRAGLVQNLVSALGYKRFHVYTGHPLLKRVKRTYAYA